MLQTAITAKGEGVEKTQKVMPMYYYCALGGSHVALDALGFALNIRLTQLTHLLDITLAIHRTVCVKLSVIQHLVRIQEVTHLNSKCYSQRVTLSKQGSNTVCER